MYYCVGSAAAAVCQKEQSGLNSEGCGAEAPNGLCRPPSRTTVARRQGWCVTDGKSEGCGAEAPNGLCRSSSRTAVTRGQERCVTDSIVRGAGIKSPQSPQSPHCQSSCRQVTGSFLDAMREGMKPARIASTTLMPIIITACHHSICSRLPTCR